MLWVRYYAKGQSVSGKFSKLHTHLHGELLIHLNGSVVYNIGGNEFSPKEGDVIVARAGEPHNPVIINVCEILCDKKSRKSMAFSGFTDIAKSPCRKTTLILA